MKLEYLGIIILVVIIPNAYAQITEIPPWVKTIGEAWLDGVVTFDKFVNAINFLMKEGVITNDQIPDDYTPEFKEKIRQWVNNEITDSQFLQSVKEWIDDTEIKIIEPTPEITPTKSIHQAWENTRGQIVFIFPNSVEKLLERGYLIVRLN